MEFLFRTHERIYKWEILIPTVLYAKNVILCLLDISVPLVRFFFFLMHAGKEELKY